MFNFERSISLWRLQMQSAGLKHPEIIEELEGHLREDWARRVLSGENEEQAFEAALESIGQPGLLKHEFAKLNRHRRTWLRKLKNILAPAFDPSSLGPFAPDALWTLQLARDEAPRLNHGFIGTEHLLLGLLALEDGVMPNLFKKIGVDRQSIRQKIDNWVINFSSKKIPGHIPYTPRVKKSLRLAAAEAKLSGDTCVGPEHILLGLILEGDGVAARVLKDSGLNPKTARNQILG